MSIRLEEYNNLSCVVIGGRWNPNLKGGEGWLFSKKKHRETLVDYMGTLIDCIHDGPIPRCTEVKCKEILDTPWILTREHSSGTERHTLPDTSALEYFTAVQLEKEQEQERKREYDAYINSEEYRNSEKDKKQQLRTAKIMLFIEFLLFIILAYFFVNTVPTNN
jgi:hypothetical protein